MVTRAEWWRVVRSAWEYASYYHRHEITDWHIRENTRQMGRTPLAWATEDFFRQNTNVWCLHFPHVSEKDPSLLAYTKDNDKGARDIQTPVRPGKYLREYFGEVLNEKQIAYYAEWFAKGQQPQSQWHDLELKFANTPDEIADIYMRGPFSCMDARNFANADTHPCRAYGAGDLALAYLEGALFRGRGAETRVRARTVAWPEKKIFGRVYPSADFWTDDGFLSIRDSRACAQALEEKLRAEGYRSTREGDSFDGARLLKIPVRRFPNGNPTRNGFLVPWVDGETSWLRDEGEHFMLRNRGDWSARSQTGVMELVYPYTCEKCRAGLSAGNINTVYTAWNAVGGWWNYENWCHGCREQHAYKCHANNDYYSNEIEKIVSQRGTVYCWRNAPPTLKAVRERAAREAPNDVTQEYAAQQGVTLNNAIPAFRLTENPDPLFFTGFMQIATGDVVVVPAQTTPPSPIDLFAAINAVEQAVREVNPQSVQPRGWRTPTSREQRIAAHTAAEITEAQHVARANRVTGAAAQQGIVTVSPVAAPPPTFSYTTTDSVFWSLEIETLNTFATPTRRRT